MQFEDVVISIRSKTITDTFTATSMNQPVLGAAMTRTLLGKTFSFIIDSYVFNPVDWKYHITGTYDIAAKLNQDVLAYAVGSDDGASVIANNIIDTLGKGNNLTFDDFRPTGLKYYNSAAKAYSCNDTFAGVLHKLFGWTDIVPNILVNVFERGGTIYAVQRGREWETTTLDGNKVQYGSVVYERSLMKLLYDSEKTYYLSGELNDCVTEDSTDATDGETLVSGQFTDLNNQMTLVYKYGLLQSEVFKATDGTVTSTTNYTYNPMYPPANLIIKQTVREEDLDTTLPTLTENMLPYKVVKKITNTSTLKNTVSDNGVDLIESSEEISTEKTGYYITDVSGKIGDSFDDYESSVNLTVYSDMGQGQWCVTSYKDKKLTNSQVVTGNPGAKASPYAIKHHSTHVSRRGGKVTARKVALPGKFSGPMSINVCDMDTLERVASAIKNMNGKTQEKVSLVYLGTRFCDFTAKIVFNGNSYFLESNTISQTPAGGIQQALQLVRWY